MPERQLDKLANLCHLLAAAANVVVPNLVEVALFVLTLDRLALAMDDGILCDDTELWGIDLYDLELDLSHASAGGKCVTLSYRSVGFAEVWGEENVE
jgi:hypothetical protein